MKTIALGLLIGLMSSANLAHAADTTTLRDPDGRKLGTISREGNRDVLRDPNGDAKSYWQTEGNVTVHRDMDGRRLGTATTH